MIGFWKHTVSRFKSAYQARGGDWDELQRSLTQAKALFEHHQNVLAFSAGFLFDSLTLDRIDAWLDLVTLAKRHCRTRPDCSGCPLRNGCRVGRRPCR